MCSSGASKGIDRTWVIDVVKNKLCTDGDDEMSNVVHGDIVWDAEKKRMNMEEKVKKATKKWRSYYFQAATSSIVQISSEENKTNGGYARRLEHIGVVEPGKTLELDVTGLVLLLGVHIGVDKQGVVCYTQKKGRLRCFRVT